MEIICLPISCPVSWILEGSHSFIKRKALSRVEHDLLIQTESVL